MTVRLRTLIVDDEFVATSWLVRLPLFEVVTACDGNEALAVLDRTPMDLILVDIEITGMACCR